MSNHLPEDQRENKDVRVSTEAQSTPPGCPETWQR